MQLAEISPETEILPCGTDESLAVHAWEAEIKVLGSLGALGFYLPWQRAAVPCQAGQKDACPERPGLSLESASPRVCVEAAIV